MIGKAWICIDQSDKEKEKKNSPLGDNADLVYDEICLALGLRVKTQATLLLYMSTGSKELIASGNQSWLTISFAFVILVTLVFPA